MDLPLAADMAYMRGRFVPVTEAGNPVTDWAVSGRTLRTL